MRDADRPEGTSARLTKAEREAARKREDGERDREHELEKAECEARYTAELDKQRRDHESALAAANRAHQTELAAQQNTQQVTHANQQHKVAWWGLVLATLGGFATGIATCGGKYMERDVRNQVWEATHADKERVLHTQSELLKLQEDYLGKLRQIQLDQAELAKAQDAVKAAQSEVEAVKQQQAEAMGKLKARYRQLQSAEDARVAASAGLKAAYARRLPWKNHGCLVETKYGSPGSRCDYGNLVVFAQNTPDEKVLTPLLKKCQPLDDKNDGYAHLEADRKRCETYATAFLTSKGVSAEDIKEILWKYQIRDIFIEQPPK